MPALESIPAQLVARATSGQRLAIRYDIGTNAILFIEDDWTVDVRGRATPRSVFRQPLEKRVVRLGRRAA